MIKFHRHVLNVRVYVSFGYFLHIARLQFSTGVSRVIYARSERVFPLRHLCVAVSVSCKSAESSCTMFSCGKFDGSRRSVARTINVCRCRWS